MENNRVTGRCLCGAVRIGAKLRTDMFQACHCAQCRRWAGGSALFVIGVKDLEIEGGADIAHYQSSAHGERAFCRTCGTALYWRMQGGRIAGVAVGLFDDQSDLTVSEEIFADCRAAWMPPLPDARQSSEAEQLALLADYLEGHAT